MNDTQKIFVNKDVDKAYRSWFKVYNRVKKRVSALTADNIPIDFEFPQTFVKQKMNFVSGNVEWREFCTGISNDGKSVISGQVKMSKDSKIRELKHPNAITYVYIIVGSVVDLCSGRKLDPYTKVPFIVLPGESYHLCTEDEECNFVLKYVND